MNSNHWIFDDVNLYCTPRKSVLEHVFSMFSLSRIFCWVMLGPKGCPVRSQQLTCHNGTMSGSPWAEIMALNHTDTVKWWMDGIPNDTKMCVASNEHQKHSKTSMNGLSIRVHVGNPTHSESKTSTRKSRAKAPRKECVKVEPRKQRRRQVDGRSAFKYSCAPSCTGNFPQKQPRKIIRNKCRRESQNCARERNAKAVAKAYKD